MIIRRAVNSRFTVLPNAVAQDLRLSIEARGGIAYLLSLPADWEVDLDHLGRAFRTGRDKTRGIVNELIANGYVIRQRKHAAGGTFDGFEYVIFDDPAAAREAFPEAFDGAGSPETEKTSVVEPATASPAPENQALAYKKETKNLQKQNLREARASADEEPGEPEGDSSSHEQFDVFMQRWPIKTGNRQKALASWSKLSAADRKRALEGIDTFRLASKAEGRKYLCAAHTYLDDAPWQRLGADASAAASGPVSMVPAFSRAWWHLFHARCNAGHPVRQMIAQAAEGRGYSVPQASLPTLADEQRLVQVATDSDVWRAHVDELALAGVRLPDLTAPYAWIPGTEAAESEAASVSGAAPVSDVQPVLPIGREPVPEPSPAGPSQFVSRDADPFLFARLAGRFEKERGRRLMALQSRGVEQGWYFPSQWIAEAKSAGLGEDGRVQLPDLGTLTEHQRRALHSIRSELRGWKMGPLPKFPLSLSASSPRRHEARLAVRLAS